MEQLPRGDDDGLQATQSRKASAWSPVMFQALPFPQFQRALYLTQCQEERTKMVEGTATVKLDPHGC